MKRRILSFLMAVVMVATILPLPVQAVEGCPNHPEHTEDCGYVEEVIGHDCEHEHTEDCFVTDICCIHEHSEECFPDGDMDGSPDLCTHECSEESGCVVRTLECCHEHDDSCGYAEAVAGAACHHSCEVCKPPVEEIEPDEEPALAAECVSLEEKMLELAVGDSEILTAVVLPEGAGQGVTWSSSDPSIATVVDGLVTARSVGTAAITAASKDNPQIKASCEVIVAAVAASNELFSLERDAAEFVAEVNGKLYSTIGEAFNVARVGGEMVLLQDAYLSGGANIRGSLMIDMNGRELSLGTTLAVYLTGTLTTINGGAISGNTLNISGNLALDHETVVSSKVINQGTISGGSFTGTIEGSGRIIGGCFATMPDGIADGYLTAKAGNPDFPFQVVSADDVIATNDSGENYMDVGLAIQEASALVTLTNDAVLSDDVSIEIPLTIDLGGHTLNLDGCQLWIDDALTTMNGGAITGGEVYIGVDGKLDASATVIDCPAENDGTIISGNFKILPTGDFGGKIPALNPDGNYVLVTPTFSAEGNALTVSWEGGSATATLAAKTDLIYHGSAQVGAEVVYSDSWPAGLPALTVRYEQDGLPIAAPINAGCYLASITLEGETASCAFAIQKANTSFAGGVKVNSPCAYGEPITVSLAPSPAHTQSMAGDGLLAIYLGDDTTPISNGTNVENGVYTMTIDSARLGVGTHTLVAKYAGTDNMADHSENFTVTVNAADLSSATVTIPGGPFCIHDTPAVTVTLGKQVLEAETDYTVTYINNAAAGEAAATISGIGNYTGTITAKFTVIDPIARVITAGGATVHCDSLLSAIQAAGENGTVMVQKDLTVTEELTIPNGVTLVVPKGITLTNHSQIILESGGVLTNYGTIDNTSGTIDRTNGVFQNHGAFLNASISYRNETITGLTAGAAYTINDEPVSIQIDGTVRILDAWFGQTLTIVENETTYTQTLVIPARPASPASLTAVDASAKDGKILGVTPAMEYRAHGAECWTACTGTAVTGLDVGTYEVRYQAAANTCFASMPVQVEVGVATYHLTVTAPIFDSVTAGNLRPEARAITIQNSGNADAAISRVTVDSTDFTICGTGNSVAVGSSINTWTIQPRAGLNEGIYTATITVAYDGGATATVPVAFTVEKAVATVETTFYPSLEAAVTAVNTGEPGGTITLLDNITLDGQITFSQNCTLDLGVDTIQVPDEYSLHVNCNMTIHTDGGGITGADYPMVINGRLQSTGSGLACGIRVSETGSIAEGTFDGVIQNYGAIEGGFYHKTVTCCGNQGIVIGGCYCDLRDAAIPDTHVKIASDNGYQFQVAAGDAEAAKNAAARLGDILYPTLQSAIQAASPGQAMTVLRDIRETITLDKNIKIDFAGYEMEALAGSSISAGTFTAPAFQNYGTISGGCFDAVENFGVITGGYFKEEITPKTGYGVQTNPPEAPDYPFKVVHTAHTCNAWAADETAHSISGICSVCGIISKATLSAPVNLVYTGTTKEAVVDTENWADSLTQPSITYCANGNVNAGEVTATMALGGQSVSVSYTITKAASSLDGNVTIDKPACTYGEIITITAIPRIANAPAARARTAPAMAVCKPDGTQVSSSNNPVDGVYTMTINTADLGASESPITLTIQFAGNDNMDESTTTLDVVVHKKLLTPSVSSTISKVYDGSTAATGSIALTGAVNGEAPAAAGVFYFTDSNAGENKQVDVTNIALTGDWGKNYELSTSTLTAAGRITPRIAELVWETASFVYTGNSVAPSAGIGNQVGQDDVAVTVDGAQTDAGSYTAAAVALIGADSGNYQLPAEKTTMFTITKADSSLNPTVNQGGAFTYGDTIIVEFSPQLQADARIGGQAVLLQGDTQLTEPVDAELDGMFVLSYDTSSKGILPGKRPLTVQYSGDCNLNASEATVNITLRKKNVTVSGVAAVDRDYSPNDRYAALDLTHATVEGILEHDLLEIVGTSGTMMDPNAGADKAVTVTGISLAGDHAGYYSLSGQPTGITVTIRPKEVTAPTVIVTPASCAYTGSPIVPDSVVVKDGERIISNSEYQLSYEHNIDVGTATVTITDREVGNYAVNGSGSFAITRSGTAFDGGVKTCLGDAETSEFTYGDSITIKVTPKLARTRSLAPNQLAIFRDGIRLTCPQSATMGQEMTFTVNTAALGAGDHILTAQFVGDTNMADFSAAVPVSIAKKSLGFSLKADGVPSNIYDGSDVYSGELLEAVLDGIVPGDRVDYTVSYQYDSANVGSGKAITGTVLLDGDAAKNYTLGNTTAKITGSMMPKPVTAAIVGTPTKVYDGTSGYDGSGLSIALSGVLNGDEVTASATYQFEDANVGTNKAVTASIQLKGSHAGNYVLSNAAPTAIGSITQADSELTLHVSQDGKFTYGDMITVEFTPAIIQTKMRSVAVSQAALYWGDVELAAPVQAENGTFALSYDTAGKAIPIGDSTLTVKYGGNGNLRSGEATVQVTLDKKDLTVTGITGVERAYEPGNLTVALHTENAVLNGLVDGDDVAIADGSGMIMTADAGVKKTVAVTGLSLTGSHGSFYQLSAQPADVTVTISPKIVSNATVVTDPVSCVYTGYPIIPTVAVYDGQALIPAEEYTVVCTENVGAGTAKAAVTDQPGGNYSVSGVGTFTILQSETTFGGENAITTYDAQGKPQTTFAYGAPIVIKVKPAPESPALFSFFGLGERQMAVFYDGQQVSDAVDADQDGWYTMTVDSQRIGAGIDLELIARFRGFAGLADKEQVVKVSITQASIANAIVTYTTPQTYTGQEIPFVSSVTLGDMLLEEGVDYTISYKNASGRVAAVNAGDYEMTVTGMGNFEGKVKIPKVTIAKAVPPYPDPGNLTAATGQALFEIELPAGWTWDDPGIVIGNCGPFQAAASFTPDDPTNYKTVTLPLDVTVDSHLVTFETGNGSPVASVIIKHGEKLPKPEDPTRVPARSEKVTAWGFGGWFMDDSFRKPWNFDDAVDSTLTLYAKWDVLYSYTLVFDDSTTAKVTSMPENTMDLLSPEEALTFTIPAGKPKRAGYSFAGWNTLKGGSGVSYSPGQEIPGKPDGKVTLYAQWKKADPTNSKTGDYILIAAAVLVVSGLALAGLMAYDKKKKK